MCVGKPCKIENFYKTFHRQQNLIERNVAFYGSYFQEDDAAEIQQNIKNVFEVDKIEQFLSEKKKLEILSYMKAMLHERIYDKTLSDRVLSRGKEEILQAVYTYFGKKEIQNMIDDGEPIEVNCHFCNTHYHYSVDDLKRMLNEATR